MATFSNAIPMATSVLTKAPTYGSVTGTPPSITSNAAATGTKPPVLSSPAEKTFVDSQITDPNTPLPSSSFGPWSPNYQADTLMSGANAKTPQELAGAPTTGGGGSTDPTMRVGDITSTTAPQTAYDAAMSTYLDSLKSANALGLQAQKDQEKALDSGETLGFATGEAARVNRNNSFAVDAANNLASVNKEAVAGFKDRLPAVPQPFNLSPGETRYDASGNPIASQPATPPAASTAGFSLSPGENRYDASGNLIASGGPKPISQAQETAQIANTEKEKAAQQQATQSIGNVNNLLSNDAYKAITGIGQNPLNIFGITNAKALNEYNQLQGMLKLGIRGLLKGQGAVSDYEGRILSEASSALGRNLSNDEFKQALLKIRGVLQTNAGGEAQVIIRDKSGKALGQGSLTGQDIYDAVNDGNTIEYL